ncbi:MAG TPA: hypothetical protein VNZ54_11270 [bacterium]|jgi:hypothetical protein|nr:hypothetical protein [bacterium]
MKSVWQALGFLAAIVLTAFSGIQMLGNIWAAGGSGTVVKNDYIDRAYWFFGATAVGLVAICWLAFLIVQRVCSAKRPKATQ